MSDLSPAQRDFLELLVTRQSLSFGDFTLKSGRKSPYFINTGCFHRGGDIAKLGAAYGAVIAERFGKNVDVIFGPAYKGIPLALGAAQAYERIVGREIGWTFDRKEAKDHGDRGSFVGAPLAAGSKVVVVDDVITAGTALRESLTKLKPTGATILGAVVAVDREEKGTGTKSALKEMAEDSGIPVHAIISISQAVDYLSGNDVAGKRYLTTSDRERIVAHVRAG